MSADDSICEPSLHPNKSSGDIGELKPCPFCGSEGHTLLLGFRYSDTYPNEKEDAVACPTCEARAPLKAWNTRTPDPESAAEIERLRREVEGLQRALIFWMPSVDLRLDEPTRELSAQDAGLLVGYSGPTDGPCWGDAMLDRALTAESAVAAAWEAIDAATTYYNGYCQDEADERENCISDQQHIDAIELRDKLFAASAIRAASGSAKTAESGNPAPTRERE